MRLRRRSPLVSVVVPVYDVEAYLADTLNALMAALTTENLTELNGQVSIDRAKPEDVAHQFLEDEGLLS